VKCLKLKRLIKPTLGFQSMKTAYATIKGFEVMLVSEDGDLLDLLEQDAP
jgi:IS6 family transposase